MKKSDQNSDEYKECAFISNALKNGWLVSDIDNLQSIYRGVQVGPAGEHKNQAEFFLRQISEVRMDKLVDRSGPAARTIPMPFPGSRNTRAPLR